MPDDLESKYGVAGFEEITGAHNNPRNKYRHNLKDLLESDEIPEQDKHAAVEYLQAIDPDNYSQTFINTDGKQETKSPGTLHSYAHNLKRVATIIQTPLTEIASADEINEFFDRVSTGNHPHSSVKADGYSAGTLKGWQSAISKFYQYHDSLPVEPHEIVIAKQKQTHVDERDMFTVKEVEALREACDNPRDRCLLELLLNTGQRIRAIQTLRVKDVDVDEGVYWLNTDADGLKGADKNGGKRPLLGAKQAVYDWLQYHPKPDPEARLITKRPGHSRGVPGESIAQSSMRRSLKKIADKAEVDKPPNPHNFRHYFVTIAKREYNMDDATVKYLIGHSADSTVMETTYQHLTDEDYLKDAETAAGIREPEEPDSPLTPDTCPTCGNQLKKSAKACDRCGAVFTPDAQSTQQQLQQDIGAEKVLSGDDVSEEDLEAIAQDDALLAKLIEMRSE